MSSPQLTPAMQQFHAFKKQHPDCILFFRMGDFYELFYEDAKVAAKAIGLTLTQRTEGIPMAGMPYHSVDGYLRRMLKAGHRVAICEQMEDPAQAKGVVRREVTRVVTPGTLTDESLLDEARENSIAAVWFADDEHAAVACAELSTGAFTVMELDVANLRDELARIGPAELLHVETANNVPPPRVKMLAEAIGCPLTARPAWQFRFQEASEALRKQFQVTTLAGYGLREDEPVIGPAGALLFYLLETQKAMDGRLSHLLPPRRYERSDHLVIDQTSLRSLEIERTLRTGETAGTLLGALQDCRTAMGKRMLRQWLCFPLTDRARIIQRQEIVALLAESPQMAQELEAKLSGVQDIQRISGRVAIGRPSPRDLVALGQSLGRVGALGELLAGAPAFEEYSRRLVAIGPALQELSAEIAQTCIEEPPAHLREGGLIRDGRDRLLDECRSLQSDSNAWLAEYQKSLVESTNIPSLKVGYNKVFGFYIEITHLHTAKIPDHFSRKQTLKNAERYITPELKDYENKVLSASSRAIARENELFAALCGRAGRRLAELHEYAAVVADLDVLGCMARRAVRYRYTRPTIVDEPVLQIIEGRHPVLDQILADRFVPNDVELDGGKGSLALITGPNMAGKSTYIRQTALLTLLAHTGSFIPAKQAVIGLTDRIFTRIGASDEIHMGQSTFMVEMTETANICHHVTGRSLVILDEIGRGTSTLDGLSLAWAIAEHLAAKRARTLFATHYHELTDLAGQFDNIVNLNVAVREWKDQIVFLHRISPGSTDKSYGIHVAKIAGLPATVVDRARHLMSRLEVHTGDLSGAGAGEGGGRAARSGGRAKGDDPQLSLFTQIIEHPAMDTLRQADLQRLSPLDAFDLLRRLKVELDEKP